MKRKGYFVTFEGGEGGGKTTQVRRLAEVLRERGHQIVLTREPGGTVLAEHVRAILQNPEVIDLDSVAELLLFQAARAQHVASVIRPAVENGQVVICDRYTDSSLVYQGFARGIELETIQRLNEIATRGMTPDCTFLLDVPVEVGFQRLGMRPEGLSRIEKAGREFHETVRQGFLQLAQAEHRFVIVAAEQSVDQVHEVILNELLQRMG